MNQKRSKHPSLEDLPQNLRNALAAMLEEAGEVDNDPSAILAARKMRGQEPKDNAQEKQPSEKPAEPDA